MIKKPKLQNKGDRTKVGYKDSFSENGGLKKAKINKKPRVLLYDLETAYTEGAVWGLFEQNVAAVLEEPYILTVAYKWLGEKTTKVKCLPDFKGYKENKKSDKELVKFIWNLFDEADIIIAHNGNSFDQKWTYARFIVNGLPPPSPAKYIDTKLVAKSKFKFNSNSLNSLGKYFNIGSKVETGGIQLWIDCMKWDIPSAWEKMCKYNIQDVILLEKVYITMLPFITNHPNINLLQGTTHNCPNCGGINIIKKGFACTRTALAQRYKCLGCGGWSQGNKIIR